MPYDFDDIWGNAQHVSEDAEKLPGYSEVVSLPCGCYPDDELGMAIIHLNDVHGHSREVIANWLDELHDSGKVNIEFEPWGSERTS